MVVEYAAADFAAGLAPRYPGDMDQYDGTSDVLACEMRARGGAVGEILDDDLVYLDHHLQIARGAFLFRSPGNVRFLYRRGSGLVIDLPGPGAMEECRLYLQGTVFGIVAWLNGMLPLHASCVAADGRAVAFTADSGGGKSTLAAALAGRGFQHVCDDTLVLEPGDAEVIGHADGKPLKLWDDAYRLVDAERREDISFVPGKSFAQARNKQQTPVVLSDLVFLEYGETVELVPITGAEKAVRLPETFYRGFVPMALADHALHARFVRQVITNIRFWRGIRPKGADCFDVAASRFATLLT